MPSVPKSALEMPRGSYSAAFQRRHGTNTPGPSPRTQSSAAASIRRRRSHRRRGKNAKADYSPTTATQTCSRRTMSATLSSSPTTSGFMNFQFRRGPGGAYLPTADVKPWPIRAPSRSINHASRFPVSFAELVRAPQYLQGEHQLSSSTGMMGRRRFPFLANNHPARLPRQEVRLPTTERLRCSTCQEGSVLTREA